VIAEVNESGDETTLSLPSLIPTKGAVANYGGMLVSLFLDLIRSPDCNLKFTLNSD
jgi:hypothetical protein